MHYYGKEKGIDVTHGNIVNGLSVLVRFERCNDDGWAYAEGKIPQFDFHESRGFMEVELDELRNYMVYNAYRIWENAGKFDKESLFDHFCRLTATDLSELSLLSETKVQEKFYQGLVDLKISLAFVEEDNEEESQ